VLHVAPEEVRAAASDLEADLVRFPVRALLLEISGILAGERCVAADEARASSAADVLGKNTAWLKEQMASGNRILDIGLDAARPARSEFYSAETKLLQAAGYARQYLSSE
jgi:hypothetical protein